MATTGAKFPTSGTTADRAAATAWTSPENIVADDTSYASAAVPTDYLIATGFDFSVIPDGSVIDGITVVVNASETGTSTSDYVPQLCSAATPTLIGSAKSPVGVSGSTKVSSSNGGATDKWGATLTSAIVKAAGFGVVIWSTDTTNTLSVDFITIDVAYTAPVVIAPDVGAVAVLGYEPTLSVLGPPEPAFSSAAFSTSAFSTSAFYLDAAGTTIQVPIGAIVVAGYAPTLDIAISPPVGAVVATGLVPIAVNDKPMPMAVGAVAILGYAPALDTAITTPAGSAVIGGLVPSLVVSDHVSISPPTGAIIVDGYGPVSGSTIETPTGALDLLGYAPTLGTAFIPFLEGEIDIAGQVPQALVGYAIEIPASAITTLGYAPVLVIGAQPAFSTLAFSTDAFSVTAFSFGTGMPSISVPAGAIVVAGYAPAQVETYIAPQVGAVVVQGYGPSLALPGFIAIPAGAITIEAYGPGFDPGDQPPTLGFGFAFGVGEIAALGYEPSLALGGDQTISPPTGAITTLGYGSVLDLNYWFGVTPLTLLGYLPTLTQQVNVGIEIPLRSLFISGNDAQIVVQDVIPPASLVLTGYAPTINVNAGREPGVGSLDILGYQPVSTATLDSYIDIPLRTLVISGNDAQVIATGNLGGGGPGLLLALGLNLEIINFTFNPAPADLQFTTWVPGVGASFDFAVPAGAVSITGYAPSVSTAEGAQTPVMQAPVALAITGHAPVIFAGKRVRFEFLSNTQDFVATPDVGSAMVWDGATGNPLGSLRTITTGFNRDDHNVWTLDTDWISLGIPVNQTVTGIALSSSESRVTQCDQGSGVISAAVLTPTGYPPIQIAAARNFSSVEAGWTNMAGAGQIGLAISSNGSLTIELGSNVVTGGSGTPEVRLFQDNIDFVVTYIPAVVIEPPTGSIAVGSTAPDVAGTAAEICQPGAASLAIEGSGPNVQVGIAGSTGGGGPGLLLALGLTLEPTPLGNASLVITGYAPQIFRPITLGGSDDLLSVDATLAGSGAIIVVGSSTIETPANATLVIAGHEPTLELTGSRNFAMPVTALTFTFYVPTLGVDHVRDIPAGTVVFDGFAPSMPPDTAITPAPAPLTIAGLAPVALASATLQPDVGAVVIAGQAPSLAYSVVFDVPAGSLTIAGLSYVVIGGLLWQGSGTLASQRATASGSGVVTRRGSGALQSLQPLLFIGTGARGSTATADMRSGPASFHGPIHHAGPQVVLVSGRATLKARAKVVRFKPHKPPKPQRVNRYTVQLKPNKRHRIGKPNRRRPGK